MTKKYFFRGLGVGIIAATAVFFIMIRFNDNENKSVSYSQNEIIERAKKLGMIFVSEVKPNKESIFTENEIIRKAKSLGMIYPEEAEVQEKEINANNENMDTIKNSKDRLENTIEITIPLGASSEEIAQLLFEHNVIDNMKTFNSYIYKKGYSKKLPYGTYTFTESMTIEDVIQIFRKQ